MVPRLSEYRHSGSRARLAHAGESAQTTRVSEEQRTPAGEIRQDAGLGRGIDRADRVDHDRGAALPAQQPFHGLLHAIVGGDAVDDEKRVCLRCSAR